MNPEYLTPGAERAIAAARGLAGAPSRKRLVLHAPPQLSACRVDFRAFAQSNLHTDPIAFQLAHEPGDRFIGRTAVRQPFDFVERDEIHVGFAAG